MKKYILTLIVFFIFKAVCSAQDRAKASLCVDTLKPIYTINRISSTFLDSIFRYQLVEKLVAIHACNDLLSQDTALYYPTIICKYADMYYGKERTDSVFLNIRNYLYNFKLMPNQLDLNVLSIERGMVVCLSKSKDFIRLIPVDACLQSKQFRRLLRSLRKKKAFAKVCFIQCNALNFGEF